MSNNTNEDTLPQATDGAEAPARKRAAKKTVAKKAAVKKVAAKKVARKSAAKADASSPELPFNEPVAAASMATPAEPTPAKPARAPRAKKAVAAEVTPEPTPAVVQQAPVQEEPPRRIGRVPGGGPVSPREPAELRHPQPAAAERADQAPNPPSHERRERAPQEGGQAQSRDPQSGAPSQESRSKRRREKRKRRKQERQNEGGHPGHSVPPGHNRHRNESRGQHGNGSYDSEDRRSAQVSGPKIEADGMLELAPKGFGFLRIPGKNFEQARDDVFVTPEMIRKYNLRVGQWLHGLYQEGPRGPQLVEVTKVNDLTPEEAVKLPHFDELKAINPSKRISFETTPERFTTRVVDIMAPVGRGQRGLIVSPPRSGKTTLLLHMAEAIREKYDETIHLMVVLIDERPEEVTEFRRALPGAEIYASSNDEQARSHTRIAELAIERAKRLVEAGRDVFLIMDSITRLARAYNGNMNHRGRGTGSGGITIGALEVPRRLFAAARNTRGGGSLTILATALIQTNSRADEAIYMEFKGTGNMELVLDRKIAENYIYPAVDIFKSGTRREELLLADHMLHKIHLIRRGLSGHRPTEAMERLLFFQKKFPNNPQMLLEIKG
jgi:transcription termination factor Rho